ncbi:MAG: bifunctional transcriptional activator/DNA repair enzyme AdaA, partial [Methylocella sp.]
MSFEPGSEPGNVSFHLACADAERAGFRPCKRCKPNEPALVARHAAKVAEICRGIESTEEICSLGELARKAGLSAYHFHRLFKTVTGVTPRAYAIAHRVKRIRDAIAKPGTTVTAAIYDAGFNSSGRFYESSNAVLGMTPTDYRAGGVNTGIRFAIGECSLGSILVASTENGVCAIFMGDDADGLARDLQDRFPRAELIGADADFEALIAKVVGFVEAPA